MQKQLYSLSTLAVLYLFSCQSPIVFDKPQPADVAALGGFPKRIQGNYLSSADSSYLQITDISIIRIYDFYQKVHVSQLDSNQQLLGDTLFNLRTNKGELIQIEGDSIVEHINEADTLFIIDELNILKKFKGYYFVNNYFQPNNWQVKKLEFSHGKLTLSSISPKEDLSQLKALTENTMDTVSNVFSPTLKQFKKFVRHKGFRDTEEYIRIRN